MSVIHLFMLSIVGFLAPFYICFIFILSFTVQLHVKGKRFIRRMLKGW
jgi:hypothetical protein